MGHTLPIADASADRAGAPLVRMDALVKRFGAFTAVDGLTLDIVQGEFFALLGPSGCGKTTLLRMLAGFEQPDAGRILLDGADISGVPPYRRPVNMMFQSYALFPHLSVAGNIAFGLKREGMARARIAERVADLLRLVRLEGFGERRPHQLSGGQRQRVALARALAKRPRLLLLDEPLAALDKKLREETQYELKEIQRTLGLTFIVVTHDQQEAMALADRIGVMERGRLAQVGRPRDVYDRPASRYVASFIGDINILDCVVDSVSEGRALLRRKAGSERLLLTIADSDSEHEGLSAGLQPGRELVVSLRPERLALALLSAGAEAGRPGSLAGTVVGTAFLGGQTSYRIALGDGEVLRVATANAGGAAGQGFEHGSRVAVTIPADAGVVLRG